MADWTKIGIISGIGAGVVGLFAYFSKLRNASVQMEAVTTAKIHSLKLDGLTIRVDVQLKNPSAGSFSIKFPFVKLLFKNAVVGTSQVIDKDIKIPAYGEANIEAIMVKIPMTSIFSIGAGLIKMLAQKQPAAVSVMTISTIDLGWKKLPYEKTDNMTLNPPA